MSATEGGAARAPPSEQARLDALHGFAILDTPPEKQFDHVVELVRSLLEVPVSLVSLIDGDRQWFKAAAGLDAQQTPRDIAFCNYAIRSPNIFEVCDATKDERFSDNPLVTGDPHIRYYIGAPLVTAEGAIIGTLCAIDTRPRDPLDERRRGWLERLAQLVISQIELHRMKRFGRIASIVAETSSDALVLADNGGIIVSWNAAAESMFGWGPAEAVGKPLAMILPDRHREAYLEGCAGAGLSDLSGSTVELEARHRDGSEFPVEWSLARWAEYGSADTDGFASIIRDISARKTAEREQEELQHFLDTVIEQLPSMLFVKDEKTRRYVRVNSAAADALGLRPEDMIGKTDEEVFGAEETRQVRARDDAVFASDRVQVYEGPLSGAGPKARIVKTRRVAFSGKSGRRYLIGITDDITEQQRARDRIDFLAHHDGLTGLKNRKAFLEAMLEDQHRDRTFDIFLCSISNFRRINDLHGRPGGDALLVQIAYRLRQLTEPAGGLVARVGGDEFAVLQDGLARPAERRRFAESLMAALTSELCVGGVAVPLEARIGMARFPRDGDTPLTLMRAAELALCQAREGCETICCFESRMDATMRRRNLLETDLPGAFDRDEMYLAFQPQADLESGRIAGFEALARWDHPEEGSIGPENFVRLAEQNGLILELGAEILGRAAREAASWSPPLSIAVNVSPGQLHTDDLPARVTDCLEASGLAPERLELEITEGMLLEGSDQVIAALHELKELGVRIAIDDFGTGYSSLGYFDMFPFDKVKIDGSFIRKMEASKHARAVIRAVIGLSRDLGIEAIAEGVEKEAELAMLRDMGCNQVQGYLIGRPGRIENFERVVVDRRAVKRNAA